MWLDPQFWANHFRNVFAKQTRAFCESFVDRLLPAFDHILEEAEEVEQREYERLASQPATGKEDMGDIAEYARDSGIGCFEWMSGVNQGLTNLMTVGLYHLFEQQFLLFYRRQVLGRNEEDTAELFKPNKVKARLDQAGIKVEELPSWPTIKELRLVADTVKHAEGVSAKELRAIRPDLFLYPQATIYAPMSGEDVHVEIHDFERYRNAILDFWNEFGTLIQTKGGRRVS
jgi:hypothetical protein